MIQKKKFEFGFDINYLGHDFDVYISPEPGEYMHDYSCLKCKVRIVYNPEVEYERFVVVDDSEVFDPCLTCEENIIKNIIE